MENLKHLHPICRFKGYDESRKNAGESMSYSDLDRLSKHETPEPTDYYMPELMSGSDYSGEAVTVSNHRLFLEQFKDVDGVHEVDGGYGTYAVAIRLNAITEDMLEIFNGLENYPCIDDEDVSRVEIDGQNESWDSWARHDFLRALQEKFPTLEDVDEQTKNDALSTLFYELADQTNTYWENETGNSEYIDIGRIVAGATEDHIKPLLG